MQKGSGWYTGKWCTFEPVLHVDERTRFIVMIILHLVIRIGRASTFPTTATATATATAPLRASAPPAYPEMHRHRGTPSWDGPRVHSPGASHTQGESSLLSITGCGWREVRRVSPSPASRAESRTGRHLQTHEIAPALSERGHDTWRRHTH